MASASRAANDQAEMWGFRVSPGTPFAPLTSPDMAHSSQTGDPRWWTATSMPISRNATNPLPSPHCRDAKVFDEGMWKESKGTEAVTGFRLIAADSEWEEISLKAKRKKSHLGGGLLDVFSAWQVLVLFPRLQPDSLVIYEALTCESKHLGTRGHPCGD